MSIQTEVIKSQIACAPVEHEFGVPPDPELMQDPDLREVADDVADRLEAAHAYLERGERTGVAAATVLNSLGCAACELENVCTVQDALQEKVAIGRENSELVRKATMLSTAPSWLATARFNQPEIAPETLQKVKAAANNPEKTNALLKSGELDLDQLLGGVMNEPAGLYTKASLPELQKVQKVDPNEPIPAYTIVTENNDRFVVLDASQAVGFKGAPPSAQDYAVLTTKLLGRMKAHDQQGNPQILRDDQKMQKAIYKLNGVPVFELRMNGKNRMYIAVDAGDQNAPTRITILGSHGGDAQTQRDFLDVALAQ